MTALLIGADVGGTTTRVAVADAANGAVLGMVQQPSGNPNVVGLNTAAHRIRTAVSQALEQAPGVTRDVAASNVCSGVFGMSGYATARTAGLDFARACCPEEVPVTPRIVSDFAVAYSSATPAAHGYVTIAGTGAGAAEIDQAEIIRRRDGWGWLLGDQGSGFWLGREAIRAALRDLERAGNAGLRTPESDDASLLTERVLGRFDAHDLNGLLSAVYRTQPHSLAELAGVVTELADRDHAAATICEHAGKLLADLVYDLSPEQGSPIVVAGSVFHRVSRIRSAFARQLSEPGPGRSTTSAHEPPVATNEKPGDEPRTTAPAIHLASSGLIGALWCAAASAPDGPAVPGEDPSSQLYDSLTRSVTRLENAETQR